MEESKINDLFLSKKYLIDFHTHTIASGHAKDTIEDMVESAKKAGLELYGITDHTKTMPGTAGEEYFRGLKNQSRDFFGIKVFFGAELNIIDYDGNVDMDDDLLSEMDICIASIHPDIGYRAGDVKQNTKALILAMENPYVKIIGHPDDERVPVDYEELVKASIRTGTILELNNNSMAPGSFRGNTVVNDEKMLKVCMKYDVPIIVGSDAHDKGTVGRHDRAVSLMKKVEFPIDLVLNYDCDKAIKLLELKEE